MPGNKTLPITHSNAEYDDDDNVGDDGDDGDDDDDDGD